MSSKGISPLIAVVLLIAFTVAVAGVISLWLTGFTTTTTGSVESASTNQTKCAGVYIDVISVTNDTVIFRNPGSQQINSVVCYSSGGENITSGTINLAVGDINSTSWVRGSNSSVICSGTCLNIGVTGECNSGQTCWKV
jgi:flagellin-like protein